MTKNRETKRLFNNNFDLASFILNTANVIAYLAALFLVALLVYEYGFVFSPEIKSEMRILYKAVWVVYLVVYLLHMILGNEKQKKSTSAFGLAIEILLLTTLIPVIFNKPESGLLMNFWEITDNHYFRLAIITILSFHQLSLGVTKMLGKRTSPSFILAASFLIIIVIGTGLLMTPKATTDGITFTDALFTATSAVCVTGLTTVDVSTAFTTLGHTIIILLIQIGGLGVMTFTSFFAMFFMGNTSIYNQIMMKDVVNSKSISSILSTLVYILIFTLVIEGVGAILIMASVHGTMHMSLEEEIWFSVFHSISAFCNAGFSTLHNNLNNPLVLHDHNWLFVVISILIILGGIGFPILVNMKEVFVYKIRNTYYWIIRKPYKIKHISHIYNLNTKIVLVTTIILLVFGTAFFAAVEWNNSLAGMSLTDKLAHSFFNATTPRTAGFVGLDITTFMPITILMIIALMWIGGGAQSTAGGLKVNAFAAIMLNMRATLRNRDKIEVFKRTIAQESIQRAHATLTISIIVVLVSATAIAIIEPDKSLTGIIFECVSAVNTVGSSLNMTPTFSIPSKYIIIILMFIGRVGILTFMLSFYKAQKNQKYKYPSDNIIIN